MPVKKSKSREEPDAGASPDFETALQQLQKIVEDMEGDDLTLEQMMGSFEEGRRLADLCNRKLQEAERKIEVLLRQGDRITTEPFEPAPDAGESAGEAPDRKPLPPPG
jgi:exodeoxyribonuclease VII small subunit